MKPLCPLFTLKFHFSLSTVFRRLDQNKDKKLDFTEFQEGLKECGIEVSAAVARECFDRIDSDRSGTINFDEFLIALRVRACTFFPFFRRH